MNGDALDEPSCPDLPFLHGLSSTSPSARPHPHQPLGPGGLAFVRANTLLAALGGKTTVWRAEDIRALIERVGGQ